MALGWTLGLTPLQGDTPGSHPRSHCTGKPGCWELTVGIPPRRTRGGRGAVTPTLGSRVGSCPWSRLSVERSPLRRAAICRAKSFQLSKKANFSQ